MVISFSIRNNSSMRATLWYYVKNGLKCMETDSCTKFCPCPLEWWTIATDLRTVSDSDSDILSGPLGTHPGVHEGDAVKTS